MLKLSLTASGLLDKSRLDAWSRQKQAAIHKAVATGMQSGGKTVADAVRSDDAVQDGNEGASGTTDLHQRTTESRNDETGNDRRPNSSRRADSAGYRKGHGKRQSQHANGHSRRKIAKKMPRE